MWKKTIFYQKSSVIFSIKKNNFFSRSSKLKSENEEEDEIEIRQQDNFIRRQFKGNDRRNDELGSFSLKI